MSHSQLVISFLIPSPEFFLHGIYSVAHFTTCPFLHPPTHPPIRPHFAKHL